MPNESKLYFRAIDEVSPEMQKIINSTNDLRKSMAESSTAIGNLQKKQSALRDDSATVRTYMTDLRSEITEAKKAVRDLGDETSKVNLKNLEREYESVKGVSQDLNRELRSTTRELQDLDRQQQLMNNQAGGFAVLDGLFKAGIGQMLGQSLGGLADAGLSSALGDRAGSAVSGILENAISGAAMGSMAGITGVAIGGSLGAISGVMQSETKRFEEREDVFRNTRDEFIQSIEQQDAERHATGVEISSRRELMAKSFIGAFGEDEAAEFINELVKMDAENPFSFDDMARISRMLTGYNFSQEDIFRNLDAVGNVGVGQGMSSQDMEAIAGTLGYLSVAPSVTKKDLKIFSSRGISVQDYIADYFDIDPDSVYDQLKNLDAKKVAEAILIGIENDTRYIGALERAGDTYAGQLDITQAGRESVASARGDAYIEEHRKALEAEDAFYDSAAGKQYKKSQELIGRWQASQDNLKTQLQFDTMAAVTQGTFSETILENYDKSGIEELHRLNEEYRIALNRESGLEMGRVLAEAEALAMAEYNQTEGAQMELTSKLDLFENVNSMLAQNEEFWDSNYQLGQEQSKGILAGLKDGLSGGIDSAIRGGTGSYVPFGDVEPPAVARRKEKSKEFDAEAAVGIPYVPHDGYMIKAHEGERVLTKNENQQYSSGKSGNSFSFSFGNIIVGENANAEDIARQIAENVLQEIELQY